MSIKVIKVISRRDVLREAQRNKHVFSTWAVISVNAYAGAFTDAVRSRLLTWLKYRLGGA